jgi:hypothetical protein
MTISEQVVLSAVGQLIIFKFLTNESAKSVILTRFRAHFGDETLSRIQVYDWGKSLKEVRTEVENMRRLRLHLLQGKLWPEFFFGGGDLIAS